LVLDRRLWRLANAETHRLELVQTVLTSGAIRSVAAPTTFEEPAARARFESGLALAARILECHGELAEGDAAAAAAAQSVLSELTRLLADPSLAPGLAVAVAAAKRFGDSIPLVPWLEFLATADIEAIFAEEAPRPSAVFVMGLLASLMALDIARACLQQMRDMLSYFARSPDPYGVADDDEDDEEEARAREPPSLHPEVAGLARDPSFRALWGAIADERHIRAVAASTQQGGGGDAYLAYLSTFTIATLAFWPASKFGVLKVLLYETPAGFLGRVLAAVKASPLWIAGRGLSEWLSLIG
ncbi:hypothetical protein HK405_012891, partial [Cladochytrium tenue]